MSFVLRVRPVVVASGGGGGNKYDVMMVVVLVIVANESLKVDGGVGDGCNSGDGKATATTDGMGLLLMTIMEVSYGSGKVCLMLVRLECGRAT